MKTLLLAAGFGTRLRPFTFLQAKASLPLLHAPLIHYPLQYLCSQGVDEVVVNLHAHSDSVKNAAGDHYQKLGITYSFEPEILGTAGAIRKAAPMLGDEPFAVMNSDMICDVNLRAVLEHHGKNNLDVTLVIMKGQDFQKYSGLYFDDSMLLAGFQQTDGTRYHYTGLQIVSPRVALRIPEEKKTDIFRDYYPDLISERKIGGFVHDGRWMEAGTLKEYLMTSQDLIQNPLPESLQPEGMSASLISPAALIETGASVKDSVIMDHAIVKAGASLDHCIAGQEITITGKFRNAALARGFLPWYF